MAHADEQERPADAGPALSEGLGLVEKLRNPWHHADCRRAADEIERLRAAVRALGATIAWQCFAETIAIHTFDDEVPLEPREAIELAAAALRPNVRGNRETP